LRREHSRERASEGGIVVHDENARPGESHHAANNRSYKIGRVGMAAPAPVPHERLLGKTLALRPRSPYLMPARRLPCPRTQGVNEEAKETRA
jgi:hypothetical protein